MAEAAALAGAKWVASTIITKLLNKGFSYFGDYFGDNDVQGRLENLETTILPQFQLVIEAAERNSEHKITLKNWLRKLKDAMYKAEEVLDLYQYELLEEEVHLLSHPVPNFFGKFVGKSKKWFSSTLSPQKKKLRDNLIKLENIAAQAITFPQLFGMPIGNSTANDTTTRGPPNVTTSLPIQVFGRDKDRDDLIDNYLLDSSEACGSEMATTRRISYSVVAIVGIGGAGKTTLAQFIYDDQRIVEKFEIKMWISVSRKLEIFSFTKEMIECASNTKCPRLTTLQVLQNKLKELIQSKKVMLVLDDVWCYETDKEGWELLLRPLAVVGRGSRILVTTRPENLKHMTSALYPENTMPLKDLEEDKFISLFMHHAFGTAKLSDHLREDLEKIGKQISQKLSRSPLVAKVVGAQLNNSLEVNIWSDTLKRVDLKDTWKVLMWSYQRLGAPLQRCFSYFSLFPKGHRFQVEEMVHLWMAEDFIDSSDNEGKRMEDIGNDYFHELVSSSFLLLVKDYGDTKYYDMPDLFHDLAENVSKEDCFRLEGDPKEKIPPTIRRLYVSGESMSKCSMDFYKLQNLRTLIISGPASISEIDLRPLLEKFKKLRALKLSGWRIESLPNSIGDLKHLRYLDLHQSDVAELPVSLGKLYHLQLLKLPSKLISLPRSFRNLLNLRHLEAGNDALSTLCDIGRLTSLQGLEYFEVKKETGYDIGQLEKLNELRGTLTISRLENAKGRENAIGAKLKDKKHLESLCLQWCNDNESECNSDFHTEVLEGLQPHPNLKKMEIRGCKSLMCPGWLIYQEKLRSLSFGNSSFEALPIISESFPRSLEKLVISFCPLLIFVSGEELQRSDQAKRSIMTAVEQLKKAFELTGDINNIREKVARDCLDIKLLFESEKKGIPADFQRIATALLSEELSMQVDHFHLWEAFCHCQELRLEAVFARRENSKLVLPSALQHLEITSCNITDGALSLCLGNLTSLKSLKLNGIKTITTVPTDPLKALCDLEIVDCHYLKSLGSLRALRTLKTLRICSCPCFEWATGEVDDGGASRGELKFPPHMFIKVCLRLHKCVVDCHSGSIWPRQS